MLNGTDLISVAKQYFEAWNKQNTNHLSFLFDKKLTSFVCFNGVKLLVIMFSCVSCLYIRMDKIELTSL